MDFNKLETKLNVSFQDKNLLKQAFTHSSYVNEHRHENLHDNERLEFLGDAVLELGVSDYLYHLHQTMSEGELSKLRAAIVCEPSLQKFAEELDFGNYLILGRGEIQTGGKQRPAILADAFEAFLGALYIDQGYEAAIRFLEVHVFPKIDDGAFSHGMDYKSKLQEMVQKEKDKQIKYETIDEKGPAHQKEFVVALSINEEVVSQGVGHSKKEAEQRAAKDAIDSVQSSQEHLNKAEE